MLAPAQQQQAVSDAIKDKIQPTLKKSTTSSTTTKSQRATDMSTTINALLSLRDAVFKTNWGSGSTTPSKQPPSSNSNSPLNLGLLAATSTALDEVEDVPGPGPTQTVTSATKSSNNNNNNNGYLRERKQSSESGGSPVNGSPVNGHHALNLQMTRTPNGFLDGDRVTPTELIDELNRIYPQEDFSLLRAACLKKEITFTKLPRNGFGSPDRDDIQVQALHMLQQNEQYMQILQQSGLLPSDALGHLPEAAGSSSSSGGQKYSSWLHPLAMAAAAAAAGMPSSTVTSNGNGRPTNGKKKTSSNHSSSNNNSFESHVFLSPKYPVSSSTSSKPKTVAAALAASRYSPNENSIPNGRGKRAGGGGGGGNRRKSRGKPVTIAYGYEDGTLEPSSLVEVTSTPEESDLGIDLTTLESRKNGGGMHHEYQDDDSPLSGENQDVLSAASMSLESYLREAESSSKVMFNAGGGGAESATTTSSDDENMSEQDKKKRNILEAFASDPEVAGDARGVARKLKLNIRVVNKVLKEGPSKSLPALQQVSTNGCKKTVPTRLVVEDFGLNGGSSDHDFEATNNNYKSRGGGNRRKSAKPNQICDLQLAALDVPEEEAEEEEDEDPLDMVVPIKKRRVSSSSGA